MDEFAQDDWPSDTYRRRVARAGLLTREGELDLARRRDRGWMVGRWLALAGVDAGGSLDALVAERPMSAGDGHRSRERARLLHWRSIHRRCRSAVAARDWTSARVAVDELRPAVDSIPLDHKGWLPVVMTLAETLAEGLLTNAREGTRLARLEHRLGHPRSRWIELSEAIVAGERDAKRAVDDLVEANLRLVMLVARRYRGQTMMSVSDLVQEGNLGLIRAAERFDPCRGLRFATYAMFWIRQGMSRGLSNQGRTVRIPVYAVEKLIKINRIRREYEDERGREPTDEDLAKQLGLSVTRVQQLSTVGFAPIPIDARDDDDGAPLDVLEDTRAVDLDEHVSNLEHRALLSQLTDRERRVLRLRFGFEPAGEQTPNEIASELSMTSRRVREIEAQTLEKLRRLLEP
jgi:RNA polymerase primary sigma factor